MRPRLKLSVIASSICPFDDLDAGQHIYIIFGKINSGFEQSDQRNQPLFDGLNAPGKRAVQLLCGHPRLVEGLRFDQIMHRFGLGQIDAATQEGALGKLTWRGETRPALQCLTHQGFEDNRRAVRRHFHHIFAGIGMGLGKEGDDCLVELLLGVEVEHLGKASLAMGQGISQAQHGLGDTGRVRP
jgi:hypothetical protein